MGPHAIARLFSEMSHGCRLRVHPRRREHGFAQTSRSHNEGSSPQARGTHLIIGRGSIAARFIPAGAGNTRCRPPDRGPRPVHPRRRGEHPCFVIWSNSKNGSSPQARGTPLAMADGLPVPRFIPAGAGNTLRSRPCMASFMVHPRRRGEHRKQQAGDASKTGSSPQARGTPNSVCQ